MFFVMGKTYDIYFARQFGWTFTPDSFGRDGRVWGIIRKNGSQYAKRYGTSKSYMEGMIAQGKMSPADAVMADRLIMIRSYHS